MTPQAPDHIWGCDITYIRLRNGWLYLVAILDWFSRYVVSWALDDTLEMPFVLDAVSQALRTATSQIWNTDQGSQFTSQQLISQLKAAGVQISMDGRGGRWTTSLPNACSAVPSMRKFIWRTMRAHARRRWGWHAISRSTTSSSRTRRSTIAV